MLSAACGLNHEAAADALGFRAAMKITVKYDEHSSEEKHYKIAITLPSKWLGQTSDKVKELFVERYNKKYPDNELDDEDMVLAVKDNSPFTNKEWKYLSMDDTPGAARLSPPAPGPRPPLHLTRRRPLSRRRLLLEQKRPSRPAATCTSSCRPR